MQEPIEHFQQAKPFLSGHSLTWASSPADFQLDADGVLRRMENQRRLTSADGRWRLYRGVREDGQTGDLLSSNDGRRAFFRGVEKPLLRRIFGFVETGLFVGELEVDFRSSAKRRTALEVLGFDGETHRGETLTNVDQVVLVGDGRRARLFASIGRLQHLLTLDTTTLRWTSRRPWKRPAVGELLVQTSAGRTFALLRGSPAGQPGRLRLVEVEQEECARVIAEFLGSAGFVCDVDDRHIWVTVHRFGTPRFPDARSATEDVACIRLDDGAVEYPTENLERQAGTRVRAAANTSVGFVASFWNGDVHVGGRSFPGGAHVSVAVSSDGTTAILSRASEEPSAVLRLINPEGDSLVISPVPPGRDIAWDRGKCLVPP